MKREDYASKENYAYLNGTLLGVRVGDAALKNGNHVINLNVQTQHGDNRINNQVVMFTKDEKVLEQYRNLDATLKANIAARQEGKEPKFTYIEVEGIPNGTKDSRQLSVLAKPEDVRLSEDRMEFKLDKGDAASMAIITGNIARVTNHPDHKFVELEIGVNYGKRSFFPKFNVNDNGGDSVHAKAEKALYDALVSGEYGKGDKIKVSGRIEPDVYEKKAGENAGEKVYGSKVAVYGSELLESKAAKRESEAAKAAQSKAEKPAVKQEAGKQVKSRRGRKAGV